MVFVINALLVKTHKQPVSAVNLIQKSKPRSQVKPLLTCGTKKKKKSRVTVGDTIELGISSNNCFAESKGQIRQALWMKS
jgi:hypothetical protein